MRTSWVTKEARLKDETAAPWPDWVSRAQSPNEMTPRCPSSTTSAAVMHPDGSEGVQSSEEGELNDFSDLDIDEVFSQGSQMPESPRTTTPQALRTTQAHTERHSPPPSSSEADALPPTPLGMTNPSDDPPSPTPRTKKKQQGARLQSWSQQQSQQVKHRTGNARNA